MPSRSHLLAVSASIGLLVAAPLALAQQGGQGDENAAQSESSNSGEQQAGGQELSDHTVAVIQHNLHRLGFYHGNADGQWSDAVGSALQSFQDSRGLNASGQVDIETLAALGIIGVSPRVAMIGRSQGQGSGSSTGPQRGMMSGQGMGMRRQGSGTPGTGVQVYRVPPGYILVPEQGQMGD